MKAMISQPMGGKSEEEIAKVRVTEKGYSVPDTAFTDDWFNEQTIGSSDFVIHRPLYFLAKSSKQWLTVLQFISAKVGRIIAVAGLNMMPL